MHILPLQHTPPQVDLRHEQNQNGPVSEKCTRLIKRLYKIINVPTDPAKMYDFYLVIFTVALLHAFYFVDF